MWMREPTTAPDSRGRLAWHDARVVAARRETARTRSLVLEVTGWCGHRPGQLVDVRLTAGDGYQAMRCYSIASAPRAGGLELMVERVAQGVVSPWLAGEARRGDRLEVRGPIGGYLVWDIPMGGPVQLIAGGSGVVPLLSMVRHRMRAGCDVPMRLLYSARAPDDVIAGAELMVLASRDPAFELSCTLTRDRPPAWAGYARRVDRALLAETLWGPQTRAWTYVCGPQQFVATVAPVLVDMGHRPDRIRAVATILVDADEPTVAAATEPATVTHVS